MPDFQISSLASSHFGTYRETTVAIPDQGPLAVSTERGVNSPLAPITSAIGFGPATLGHFTSHGSVTPTGPLGDAISALQGLGRANGITGVQMLQGQPTSALFRVAGETSFGGGMQVDQLVQPAVQRQIATAADAVVAALRGH